MLSSLGMTSCGAALVPEARRYAIYREATARTSLNGFGDSYALDASVGFKVQ